MPQRTKISVFWPEKNCFLAYFFLGGMWGSPPLLKENHCAHRSLAEWGLPQPKIGPKTRFFSKRAKDFKLLKQVPEPSHQRGRSQHMGH